MSSLKMQPNLRVYNTMTLEKEAFQPRVPGKVNMFVCGPTVQSHLHIGHARTYTFYDVVARYLSHLGYEVNFIMNVTDVDDKITEAAAEEGLDPMRLAEKYTRAFLEDTDTLKIYTVTKYERVSNYVRESINEIATLIKDGNAYVIDGTVYFDTSTFPDFGKLSHLSQKELSLRPLELAPKKKHLLDFVLWRPVELVAGRWDSPWGRGSPGWHIQDTAVTLTNFGPQYDVHGGAYELIYPHHEAEIAQGESLTKIKPMVKYWVHTALVNTHGAKMSKSVGNVMAVRDIVKQVGSDALRFFLLSYHYRKDIDFEEKELKKSYESYLDLREKAKQIEERRATKARRRDSAKVLGPFYEALNDDFDTATAITFVKKLVEDGANEKDQGQVELYYESLRITSNILGVSFFGRYQ